MARHQAKKHNQKVAQAKQELSKRIQKQQKKKSKSKPGKATTTKSPTKSRVPAVVSDIDGVLVLGESPPINNASDTLRKVLTEHAKQIQFVLLTNGGGKTEQGKVDSLNSLIFGKEPLLKKEHMIQSHTVLMDEALVNKYRDKYILVDSMASNPIEIIQNYGYRKALTLIELIVLYPDLSFCKDVDLALYCKMFEPNQTQEGILKRLEQRLKLSAE